MWHFKNAGYNSTYIIIPILKNIYKVEKGRKNKQKYLSNIISLDARECYKQEYSSPFSSLYFIHFSVFPL